MTQLTSQEGPAVVGREEWLDIQEAWLRGGTISEIARSTGRDRKTIRRLVREGPPGPRAPRQVASKLDEYREYLIERLLGPDKVTNAAVLFDEIRERGYSGGRSILWEFLRPLRPLVEDKATVRFETPPGRQAQVDWGVFKKSGRKTVQGFVLTLGWSRASYLDFTETQALAAFLRCHEGAFHYLGGVPRGGPVRPGQDSLAARRRSRGSGLPPRALGLRPALWIPTPALPCPSAADQGQG